MDIGLPELSDEQIEEVSKTAENAARKYIFSMVKQKQVERLNISVESEGTKPVSLTVEVDVKLAGDIDVCDENGLAHGAVEAAFQAVETYLRKLT